MTMKVYRAAAQAAALLLLVLPTAALAGDHAVQRVRRFATQPDFTPIADAAGNLFGTSSGGGAYGVGYAYELVAPSGSQTKWSFRKLYDFDHNSVAFLSGRLALDGAGNLYGVSTYGGGYGGGSLYELEKPLSGNHWHLSVLHYFHDGKDGRCHDGEFPQAGVTIGPDGTIYGTTTQGGIVSVGTAYTLSPPDQSGKRTYHIIYEFHGLHGKFDGFYPFSNPFLDGHGNLIGTTSGRQADNGDVFELSPVGGKWHFQLLYRFQGGSDGSFPQGALTSDAAGNIFGTTSGGGTAGFGTVFELSPPAGQSSKWTEQVIASLGTYPGDVAEPMDGVSFDTQGRLFGATEGGGGSNDNYCFGGVFRLTPPAPGSSTWTEDALAVLGQPNTANLGCGAAGSLTPLIGGKLFGVTGLGAPPGTLYSVTP